MQALKSEGQFVWACKNYGVRLAYCDDAAPYVQSAHIFKGFLAPNSCSLQVFSLAVRSESILMLQGG